MILFNYEILRINLNVTLSFADCPAIFSAVSLLYVAVLPAPFMTAFDTSEEIRVQFPVSFSEFFEQLFYSLNKIARRLGMLLIPAETERREIAADLIYLNSMSAVFPDKARYLRNEICAIGST